VLLNTSFNVREEPIVRKPEDALHRFMRTELDALAIGECFPRKEERDPDLQMTANPVSSHHGTGLESGPAEST
jgi:hypothetical protein